MTEVLDDASRFGSPDHIVVCRSLTTDMGHVAEGARLGATPDGRQAGKPVSDNTSPYPGSCVYGLTAMFRSLYSCSCNLPSNGEYIKVKKERNIRKDKRVFTLY